MHLNLLTAIVAMIFFDGARPFARQSECASRSRFRVRLAAELRDFPQTWRPIALLKQSAADQRHRKAAIGLAIHPSSWNQ